MPIAAPSEVPKETQKPVLSAGEVLVLGTGLAAAITAIALALRKGRRSAT